MKRCFLELAVMAITACAVLGGVGKASAVITIETVPVGDVRNAPDSTMLGTVNYAYRIGKYDVTAAQYAQFLNAVATTSDPYGLYNLSMGSQSSVGCGITRSGSLGTYSYNVIPGRENFPVNYVSWGDAARFCNWLANSQPVGAEGLGTTESGSYVLNGAMSMSALMAITRSTTSTYVIPTMDEWYKAAYYKGGSTNAGYWLYPTQSNTAPSNVFSASGTNNANFYNTGYTDPVNFLTPVGAFANSPSSYGTFDQGGDVFQWTEANTANRNRAIRGGAFSYHGSVSLQSATWTNTDPTSEGSVIGFRITVVPEPASIGLLSLGIAGLLLKPRCSRR